MGNKKGMKIKDLPEEEDVETDPDDKEVAILNDILTINEEDKPQEYLTVKIVLFATFLFVLLILPFTDKLLELAAPQTHSWLILIAIKTTVFFFLFYTFMYFMT